MRSQPHTYPTESDFAVFDDGEDDPVQYFSKLINNPFQIFVFILLEGSPITKENENRYIPDKNLQKIKSIQQKNLDSKVSLLLLLLLLL